MRNGVLVSEKAPKVLLREFGCESLEEVFLRLSYVQEIESTDNVSCDQHFANYVNSVETLSTCISELLWFLCSSEN